MAVTSIKMVISTKGFGKMITKKVKENFSANQHKNSTKDSSKIISKKEREALHTKMVRNLKAISNIIIKMVKDTS